MSQLDPTARGLARFSDDHYCETLRGLPKPGPRKVLRALAMRCQWLERKIAQSSVLGKPSGFLIDELAAIIMLVEAYKAKKEA